MSEGLSAFLSRVLDQLSITAWLPAVFLVGNAAVLLAFQGEQRLVLTDAIQDLIQLRWGALVVLMFAVIIMAMVIQAFEFEGLRFWEGYLRSRRFGRWATHRIDAQKKKRTDLQTQEAAQIVAAFDEARRRALDNHKTNDQQRDMWNAMEKVMHRRRLEDGEDTIADAAALELRWPEHADPGLLHAWDITRLKLAEFPRAHRVLPTRLGNVMRAAEDHVVLGQGEDLEGFMIRHVDKLPKAIVTEHSAYRRRLEMYCGLMFVLTSLTGWSIVCLWGHTTDWGWRVAVPGSYLGAVWVSYRAAIASASGFGQAVKEASGWLTRNGLANP